MSKKEYKDLNKRLGVYCAQIQDIYKRLNEQGVRIATQTGYSQSDDKPFSFADYPTVKPAVDRLMNQFVNDIQISVLSNVQHEWKKSNEALDLLANDYLRKIELKQHGEIETLYYQKNSDALKAFATRKDKGMNLSEKLWKQSVLFKHGLETSISLAIRKGVSAVGLAQKVTRYLNDNELLKTEYKKQFGEDPETFNVPFQSMRLARSEINMAYRNAEQRRWSQMDFVMGFKICLSNKHPKEDICDDLCGDYPKEFQWTGWHPNDMCYATPILVDPDTFTKWNNGEINTLPKFTDVPENFKQYIKDHGQDLMKGKSIPYFVRDNKAIIERILSNETKN